MDYLSFLPEDFICDESFQHFCNGTFQKDILFWQTWISNNPQKKKEIDLAIEMVNMLNAKQGNLAEQHRLLKDTFIRREKFKEKVFAVAPIINMNGNRTLTAKRKYIFPAIAACLALLIFGAGYFYQNYFAQSNTEKIAQSAPTYSSGIQPRNTIVLSDGSIITLAGNSSVKLINGFSNNKREVTLYGEAYFDIRHNAASPFKVHTSKMELVVLGTVFNVKDFADSALSEAYLISGRLRVSSKENVNNTVVLKPNESVVIEDKKEKVILPSGVKTAFFVKKIDSAVNIKTLGWIRNRLSIDDQPLHEIATNLQDWYGIQIIFGDDSVKNYRYSGIFESETVIQALQALQLSYPFNFTTTPKQITITK